MHVIGTAGHVDHGKSSLVERLTGIDPDRFEEEKRRGLTIDLGFAWLPLPSGREVGIVDVPGHERFIRNMLAGAGSISICLFVVAANEGWMPQSAEHLSALDVLGVRHGVIALTKSDTVDAELLELATLEVHERIGHSSLASSPVIPCSALTGNGLDELVRAIDDVVSSAPPAPDEGRSRLWVDRVFTISGAGTVVTGTLGGGNLRAGDEVEVLGPSERSGRARRARIRTIQSHKKEVQKIEPGNRVALNLSGLERASLQRGDAVVAPGKWRSSPRFDALVRVLPQELMLRAHELTEKGSHLLYVGSSESPVRLKLLNRQQVRSGEEAYAQILLRTPLPIRRGDHFVLRDAGRVTTFGGGIVLDPLPSPARRGDQRRIGLLETLRDATPQQALEALLESSGDLDAHEALLRSGVFEAPVGMIVLGARLVSPAHARALRVRVTEELSSYHNANPLEAGMPRELLRARARLDPGAFDALLATSGDIVEEGAIVRIESHIVALSIEQQRSRERILRTLSSRGFTPPPAKELDADPLLVRALVQSGDLVPVGDFYLTAEGATSARRIVREFIEGNGAATVAQIRDVLGTTRRYAVPLCEWLDQTGATRRRGDERVLGPTP